MEITEVRVFPKEGQDKKLKAYATVTFDNCFVVRNIKVIEGTKGLFVAMPSRKIKDGSYKDIAHPIENDFRHTLEQVVLKAYNDELAKGGVPAAQAVPHEEELG